MSDEAAPYYVDMVDQQTIGHQFLLHNFGSAAIPRAGWQASVPRSHDVLLISEDRPLWPLDDDGGTLRPHGHGLLFVCWALCLLFLIAF
jgi:hypothetical protein